MTQLSSKKPATLLAVFGGLAVTALVLGAIFFLPRGAGGGAQMVIAVPDRDNESDLLLLELGKPDAEPVELGRSVLPASTTFLMPHPDGHWDLVGDFLPNFGGFVPGSDFLLYWYSEDETTYVNARPQQGGEPLVIFDSDEPVVYGYVFADPGPIFILESNDEKTYCYIASPEAEADRMGRGSDCTISLGGTMLLVSEVSDGAKTMTAVDIAGESEVTLVDEEEGIGSISLSPDGTWAAYVSEDEDAARLIVADTGTGKTVTESDEYNSIIRFGFAYQGRNLYFIAENEDGDLQLFTLDAEGEQEIANGLTMTAELNASGSHLVYMTGDADEERTVAVHSMAADTDVELADGPGLAFSLLASPERILIRQIDDDELTIFSADLDGQNVAELYSENDMTLTGIYQIPGENRVFLVLNEEDGKTLFVSPLDAESGFPMLEQWSSIELLNSAQDGGRVLIAGREDERDDTTFFMLPMEEKAAPIELDDDTEGVRNAVFSPDGKSAVYTVETGSDADEVEIRQVALDGESKYEVLYEESYLVDIQWDILYPFKVTPYWQDVLTGTSFCPGAPSLTDEAQGEWEEELCYRVSLDADQIYTFSVDSALDTRLALYDQDGMPIDSDDDSGPNLNPRLQISVEAPGTYFLKVGAPAGDTGRFTLTLVEGYDTAAYDNATMLTPGESSRGAITAASQGSVNMPDGSTYGEVYAFHGSAGDRVTIDVLAPSIGSSLDPKVYLLSPSLEELGYDDDSGDGYDSQLTITLPEDGIYFILVGSVGDQYGTASSYFYEVTLTIH